MGATHHALEDYGVLLTLQNMRVYVPAFSEDVEIAVKLMASRKGPAYLRLGRSEKPADFILPPYAAWRKLIGGKQGVLVAVGPIAGFDCRPFPARPSQPAFAMGSFGVTG